MAFEGFWHRNTDQQCHTEFAAIHEQQRGRCDEKTVVGGVTQVFSEDRYQGHRSHQEVEGRDHVPFHPHRGRGEVGARCGGEAQAHHDEDAEHVG
eukprot:4944778-Pyramimonas_sp.AAC.1